MTRQKLLKRSTILDIHQMNTYICLFIIHDINLDKNYFDYLFFYSKLHFHLTGINNNFDEKPYQNQTENNLFLKNFFTRFFCFLFLLNMEFFLSFDDFHRHCTPQFSQRILNTHFRSSFGCITYNSSSFSSSIQQKYKAT